MDFVYAAIDDQARVLSAPRCKHAELKALETFDSRQILSRGRIGTAMRPP